VIVSRGIHRRSFVAIAMALACLSPIAARAVKSTLMVGSNFDNPNAPTSDASISADGRWIVFASEATNLTTPPTTGKQVFVWDRLLNDIVLVSKNDAGEPGDGPSSSPRISGDGRYVLFLSEATNLSGAPTGGVVQAYVRDRGALINDSTGPGTYIDQHPGQDQGRTSTKLASISTDNVPAPTPVSEPAISEDGHTYAFSMIPNRWIAGTNSPQKQVVVRDSINASTAIVSMTPANVAGNLASGHPSLSANGRLVAFESLAWNLTSGATRLGDPIDSKQFTDVFVHDRNAGGCAKPDTKSCTTTTRVSLGPLDPTTGQDLEPNGASTEPVISRDGAMVAFTSAANNLVFNNETIDGLLPEHPIPIDTNTSTDVYVRDIARSVTELVSVATSGRAAGSSSHPALSSQGQLAPFSGAGVHQSGVDLSIAALLPAGLDRISPFIAFTSDAADIVAGDTNGAADVFVVDVSGHVRDRISLESGGDQADLPSFAPTISSDGQYVAFESYADLTGAWESAEARPRGQTYVVDRYVCDAREDGPLSQPISKTVEPMAGPLRGEIQDLNCSVVAQHGL
jgi:Tol biopolymer transport system component